jgi:hypothetical protein
MTTRPIAILLLTTLIGSLPEATAERKRKRRVAEDEVQTSKEEAEDQDGFEATAVLPIKLDELVEVAVRLAPELARSKNDRLASKGDAQAARKDQQWGVTIKGQFERFATSPDVELGAFQTVAENKLTANVGVGRNLPTGGNVNFEVGIVRIVRELEIPAGLNSIGNMTMIPTEIDCGVAICDTFGIVQTQAKMTLTQPLARKFGRDIALANETKGDLAMTDQTVKTQLVAEEMLRDLVTGYWENVRRANRHARRGARAREEARRSDPRRDPREARPRQRAGPGAVRDLHARGGAAHRQERVGEEVARAAQEGRPRADAARPRDAPEGPVRGRDRRVGRAGRAQARSQVEPPPRVADPPEAHCRRRRKCEERDVAVVDLNLSGARRYWQLADAASAAPSPATVSR